jgi:prepilin-type processing-associated H-X9-DG protein
VPNVGERRRIRSYSVNSFIGNPANSLPANYRTFSKVSEMNLMGAEKAFLILDEHPRSINDGTDYVDMSGFENQPSSRQWLDYPGSHHLDGTNLSFADGHVETWSWRDATRPQCYRGYGSKPLQVNRRPYRAHLTMDLNGVALFTIIIAARNWTARPRVHWPHRQIPPEAGATRP